MATKPERYDMKKEADVRRWFREMDSMTKAIQKSRDERAEHLIKIVSGKKTIWDKIKSKLQMKGLK